MLAHPCTIRNARIEDAPAIGALYHRTTRAAYRSILPDILLDTRPVEPFIRFWAEKLSVPPSREQRILVAEYDGEISGFVNIGAPSATSEVDASTTGELHYIFVDPHVSGRGVGQQLLSCATELLRQDGYRRAILWVFSKNRQARRFYEAAGWSYDGIERPDPAFAHLGEDQPLEVRYGIDLQDEEA